MAEFAGAQDGLIMNELDRIVLLTLGGSMAAAIVVAAITFNVM